VDAVVAADVGAMVTGVSVVTMEDGPTVGRVGPADSSAATHVTTTDHVPVPQRSSRYVPVRGIATVAPPSFGPATIVESVTPHWSLR
jgi:hypothetical protein